jgi:hypothetical protein
MKHGWQSPSKRGSKSRTIPGKGGIDAGSPEFFQLFGSRTRQWDHTAVLLSKKKKNEEIPHQGRKVR